MAAEGEDADLDALRSAVLASLKARGKNDSSSCVTTEDEESRHDAELEELRKAALQSKRLLDNEKPLQISFCQAGFPRIPGFRRGIESRLRFNQNNNLIVIEPVELCTASTESLSIAKSQSPESNHDLSFESRQLPKSKSSGKFSRFESDSDSDSSEENSEYSNEKSQSSNLTDDDDDDDDSHQSNNVDDNSQDAIEENVLVLHPDDDLNEIEHTVLKNSKEKTPEPKINSPDPGSKAAAGGESVDNEVPIVKTKPCRDVKFDGHRSSRSSGRARERPARLSQGLRSIKENNERHRDRFERRSELQKFRGNVERRRNDIKLEHARNDRHRSRQRTTEEGNNRLSDERRSDERRSRGGGVTDKMYKAKDKREKFPSGKEPLPVPSIVVSRRGSKERKETHSPVKDNCKTVLGSRNSSPTKPATPIDLREKLRQKKEKKTSSEVEREKHDRSSPAVKSVLTVVSSTAATSKSASADESKSKSRSPLAVSKDRRVKSPRAVRRKSESPDTVAGVSSPKTRKVLIVSEEAKMSSSKDLKKGDHTNDAVMRDLEDETNPRVVQRIPVRQRLGVSPKNTTKSSSSSSGTARRSKLACNRNATMSRSKTTLAMSSDSTEGKSVGTKRKVKLRGGAFTSLVASHPSSATVRLKQEMSSDEKSRRHKGLPTFENELDERIRRIQANNEAILKRKYEIAWDRHKHK